MNAKMEIDSKSDLELHNLENRLAHIGITEQNLISEAYCLLSSENYAEETSGIKILTQIVSNENTFNPSDIIQSNILFKLSDLSLSRPLDFVEHSLKILYYFSLDNNPAIHYLVRNNILGYFEAVYSKFDTINIKNSIFLVLFNITQDCESCKEYALFSNFLHISTIQFLQSDVSSFDNLESFTKVLSSAIKIKSLTASQATPNITLSLIKLILESDKIRILDDALSALCHISQVCKAVIYHSSEFIERVLNLITHPVISIAINSMIIIGDFAARAEDISFLSQYDFTVIAELINSPIRSIRKELAWMMSNLVCSNSEIVRELASCKLFDYMIAKIGKEDESLEDHMIWTLGNSAQYGDWETIARLVEKGMLNVLMNAYCGKSEQIKSVIIGCIYRIGIQNKAWITREVEEWVWIRVGDNDSGNLLQKQIYDLSLLCERHYMMED
jgi:hypothetical protein